MDILSLKKEVDEFLSTVTIDDYYFDTELIFLRNDILSKLAPRIESIDDNFLIEYFKGEYEKALKETNKEDRIEAVNYLAILAINSTFYKDHEMDTTWGEPYIDHKNREVQSPIYTPTGKYSIEHRAYDYTREELKKFVFSQFIPVNIISENWQQTLIEVLSRQYSSFSGIYYVGIAYENYNDDYQFRKHHGQLSQDDLMSLFSTKLAIQKNEHFISSKNEIIIGVSGGIAMKIQIRERSKIHLENQSDTFKVYHVSSYDDRFEKFTILYQEGYTKSEIKILFSRGFYFVTPDLIVEINYFPSAVLIDSTQLFKAIEDHPSLNLIEDEEEERRRLDED